MTALNIATDIPSQIDTLEKLAAWTGFALSRVNPGVKILEAANSPAQRVADVVLIKADDGSTRLVIRLSLPYAENYSESAAKSWQNVNKISDTVLPTAFKAN